MLEDELNFVETYKIMLLFVRDYKVDPNSENYDVLQDFFTTTTNEDFERGKDLFEMSFSSKRHRSSEEDVIEVQHTTLLSDQSIGNISIPSGSSSSNITSVSTSTSSNNRGGILTDLLSRLQK